MKFVADTGTCRLCRRSDVPGTRPTSYSAPPDFVCSLCDPRTYEIAAGVKLVSGSL